MKILITFKDEDDEAGTSATQDALTILQTALPYILDNVTIGDYDQAVSKSAQDLAATMDEWRAELMYLIDHDTTPDGTTRQEFMFYLSDRMSDWANDLRA
jgi:hypothetical protein